jgi:carbonic anhydrase
MGHAPELEDKTSFVGTWLNLLRPGFERVRELPDEDRTTALEKEAVLVSLENLATFPFVKKALDDDMLTLHGLWNNIGDGTLDAYDPASKKFVAV